MCRLGGVGGGLRPGRGSVRQARRRPGQCTVREPSRAPSFQNCRHYMEVGRWPGHRAGRLLYPPSEACNARSQMDEGRVAQGRSLWWQRRRAARGRISAQRPQRADLSKPGFQACLSMPGSPFVQASQSRAALGPALRHPDGLALPGICLCTSSEAWRGGADWRVCMWRKRQLGAQDSVSSYEGRWRRGLHAPQNDFGLSLELSV